MISIAAYYLAERRGFAPGGAEADWLQAERLIDFLIAERKLSPQSDRENQHGQIRYALKLTASADWGD